MNKAIRVAAGIGLIVTIFLPWFNLMGFGVAPFRAVLERFDQAWVFVLPVLGGALVVYSEMRQVESRAGPIIAAALSLTTLVILASQFGVFSTSDAPFQVRMSVGDILRISDIGLWILLLATAVLIFASFRKRPESSPVHSFGDSQSDDRSSE